MLQGFADLVKKDAQTLRPILAARYFVVKRSVDQATAPKYQAVLEKIGFLCTIELEQTPKSDDFPAQKSQRIETPSSSPSSATNVSSQRYCPQCGTSVRDGQKICGQCARNLTASQPQIAQHADYSQPVTTNPLVILWSRFSSSTKIVISVFGILVVFGVVAAILSSLRGTTSSETTPKVSVIVDAKDGQLIVVNGCYRDNMIMYCTVTNLQRDRSYSNNDFGYEVFNVQGGKIVSRGWLFRGTLGPGKTVRAQIFLSNSDANKVYVGSSRGR